MRLLHTSDWHLGQNFYSKSRAAEHDAFLTWLLARAQEHEVDAIIVAGDIFDTGSPPSYARELYNRFVVQLQQTGCRLVVLAGNHDSVAMLNESRDILAFLHTTVVANAGYAPIELPLRDGTPGAIFCPVPFYAPASWLPVRPATPVGKNSNSYCTPSATIIRSSISRPARCAAIGRCPSLPAAT